jgi:hypothetical protein
MQSSCGEIALSPAITQPALIAQRTHRQGGDVLCSMPVVWAMVATPLDLPRSLMIKRSDCAQIPFLQT